MELHDVVTGVLFDSVCATETQILASVPYVDDFLDVLLGHHVETDNAAIESLVELDVLVPTP